MSSLPIGRRSVGRAAVLLLLMLSAGWPRPARRPAVGRHGAAEHPIVRRSAQLTPRQREHTELRSAAALRRAGHVRLAVAGLVDLLGRAAWPTTQIMAAERTLSYARAEGWSPVQQDVLLVICERELTPLLARATTGGTYARRRWHAIRERAHAAQRVREDPPLNIFSATLVK